MDEAPVELWLPSHGDGLPECLLGVPLLVRADGKADSFFRLVTSSVLTPLTWGDAVRARPHPDGGYSVTALAGAGTSTRVVVSHDPGLPSMVARTVVTGWAEQGAEVVEALPGLFVIAWRGDVPPEAIGNLVAQAGEEWTAVEIWPASERTASTIAPHLNT